MSTAYLAQVLPPTRLDASQRAEPLGPAPSHKASGMTYPSFYPLPGSSYPPLLSPPIATPAIFPSYTSGFYSAGGANYFPNHQGYSTVYPPAGFIPPIEDPAPLMTVQPDYTLYNMPAGTATYPNAFLPSEDIYYYGQPPHFNYQCPLPTQTEAPPVQDQQQGQHEVQVAQEDFTVKALEPPQEPGEVHKESYRSQPQSQAALVELLVRLHNYPWSNSSHPQVQNKMGHQCSNNPESGCTGRGKICLDVLCTLIVRYPNIFSNEQITGFVIASIAPESNAGQSTEGRLSQVDTNDALPSPHRSASGQTTSLGWCTTTLTSTTPSAAHASPSESNTYPPNHLVASSSFTGTVASLTGQRSVVGPEDGIRKRREQYTNAVSLTAWHAFRLLILEPQRGEVRDHYAPYKKRSVDGGEKCRKKKSHEGEYICLICRILGLRCFP